ncbi:inositol monophosphatase family protein [Actinomycetes bacterium KLBMP 9797]
MALSDAELAIAAAEAGAAIVRSRYGTSLTRVDKGGRDFATNADLESEAAIVDTLRGARPQDAVLAEETGRHPGATDRTWLTDPLCGTVNFATHTPLVAVNVALRIGTTIAAAASAAPFTEEVYWTDGAHAYVRHGGTDTRLAPASRSALVELNLDLPSPDNARFLVTPLLSDVRFAARFDPRVSSSTLPVAWVAAGRRAAYVTDGQMHDNVHFAAGIGLCQAAGCVVTDLRGQPLGTGGEGLLIAADAPTHAALLELIPGRPARPGAAAAPAPRP